MTWRTTTLGELACHARGEVRTGPFGTQLHKRDYVDDPTATPVVMPKDMADGRIQTTSIARIGDDVVKRLSSHVLHAGDIVLGRRGEIGRRVWISDIEDGWICGTGSIRISLSGSTAIRPRFLFYCLGLEQTIGWLKGHAVGATMSNLSAGVVQQLPVRYPPLNVQDGILERLDQLEELIENNRRRIEILEEAVRLLYREWFVHFRFPGHEYVGLTDSELGMIPEEWEITSVGDVVELARGRSYRRQEIIDEGGLPFLNLKCIDRGGGFRKSGLKRYGGKFKSMQQTYPGDTVIAVTDMTQERNVVGQAGRVPLLDAEFGIISLDLARVVPSNFVEPNYLYGMFRFSGFSQIIREYANGINVLHLNPDHIRQYRFAIPPLRIQHLYGDAVIPVFDLVDNLTRQSEVLREGRDRLLPRLMSGEFDLSKLDLISEP